MVKENFGEQKDVYTDKMRGCIRDYANEFVALKMFYMNGGITSVINLLKEHTVKTFQGYVDEKAALEKYETLDEQELQNSVVQTKTKRLSEIAERFNDKNIELTDEEYHKLMDEVKQIIDTK